MEAIATGDQKGSPASAWALARRGAAVRRLAGRIGLLLPGIAVVGLALDQPGWAPLAWLAFAPLLLLQRTAPPAASAAWTAAFALGAYGLLLHPMLPVTPAGYILILAGTAAIYGLTGGLVTALWGGARWSPLGVASLWTLAEVVKTGLGLAWGTLGYSQWSLETVRLSARGVGVLMVSSEVPEVLGLADRVLVMREGRLIRDAPAGELDEEAVLDLVMAGSLMEGTPA